MLKTEVVVFSNTIIETFIIFSIAKAFTNIPGVNRLTVEPMSILFPGPTVFPNRSVQAASNELLESFCENIDLRHHLLEEAMDLLK